MFSNNFLPNSAPKFFCEKCNYNTCKKSSFDDHLLSAKHKKSMISNENLLNSAPKFICIMCSKEYKDNSGLWRHKKKCINLNYGENETKNKIPEISPELVLSILKQNNDFQELIIESQFSFSMLMGLFMMMIARLVVVVVVVVVLI